MMTDLGRIEQLLATATLAGPVDEETIRSAERELNVEFPPTYRLFLSRFGAALCTGFEFAGIFDSDNADDGPPLWSNVVTATLQKRRASNGLIPNEYIMVSDDGGDYAFYLDTTCADSRGECPVIVNGPGADAVVVAEDFFDFVVRSFNKSLAF